MATVRKTIEGFKAGLFGGRLCGECGYTRADGERIGVCPWCRAEARLAEAVAALRAENDYDAINAAADAIGSVLIDAPVFRHRSPWRELYAVKQVRDPEFPGRDDDEN